MLYCNNSVNLKYFYLNCFIVVEFKFSCIELNYSFAIKFAYKLRSSLYNLLPVPYLEQKKFFHAAAVAQGCIAFEYVIHFAKISPDSMWWWEFFWTTLKVPVTERSACLWEDSAVLNQILGKGWVFLNASPINESLFSQRSRDLQQRLNWYSILAESFEYQQRSRHQSPISNVDVWGLG